MTKEDKEFTFSCPHCGQHLTAESDWIDLEFECPTCGMVVSVPQCDSIMEGKESPDENRSQEAHRQSDDQPSSNGYSAKIKAVARRTMEVITLAANSTLLFTKRIFGTSKESVARFWRSGFVGKFSISVVGCALLLVVGICIWGTPERTMYGAGSHDRLIRDGENDSADVVDRTRDDGTPLGGMTKESVNKNGAVTASVRCLLNFMRRPNERRAQLLAKSLESCPKDFQEAVIKYLDSTRKTINDFMTETKESEEEELKREIAKTVRPCPQDLDPQLAGLRNWAVKMAVIDAAEKVKQRREYRIQSAKRALKTEIENAAKHLIDVAEKYGIDAIELEDALLD